MGNADSTHTEKVDEVMKQRRDLTISTKGDIDTFDFRVQTVIKDSIWYALQIRQYSRK